MWAAAQTAAPPALAALIQPVDFSFNAHSNSPQKGEAPASPFLMLTSLPLEGRHAIDIDEQDGRRDHIPEQRPHPRANLQALPGVGLQQEIVPAPAESSNGIYAIILISAVLFDCAVVSIPSEAAAP